VLYIQEIYFAFNLFGGAWSNVHHRGVRCDFLEFACCLCGCIAHATFKGFEVEQFALWAVHFICCVARYLVIVSFGDVFKATIPLLVWEEYY
jgi:hypothetical protein